MPLPQGDGKLTGHSVMCALWTMSSPKRSRVCLGRCCRIRAVWLPAAHQSVMTAWCVSRVLQKPSRLCCTEGSARTLLGTSRKKPLCQRRLATPTDVIFLLLDWSGSLSAGV